MKPGSSMMKMGEVSLTGGVLLWLWLLMTMLSLARRLTGPQGETLAPDCSGGGFADCSSRMLVEEKWLNTGSRSKRLSTGWTRTW